MVVCDDLISTLQLLVISIFRHINKSREICALWPDLCNDNYFLIPPPNVFIHAILCDTRRIPQGYDRFMGITHT